MNYSEHVKTGQRMIDSFEISFVRTFNPPITITPDSILMGRGS